MGKLENEFEIKEERMFDDYFDFGPVILLIIFVPIGIILCLFYYLYDQDLEREEEIYKKKQQEILNLCKTNKVLKTYIADNGTEFYVTLENNQIYKVDKDKFGYYIVGEYCK